MNDPRQSPIDFSYVFEKTVNRLRGSILLFTDCHPSRNKINLFQPSGLLWLREG